ncbi:MAG TPA: hypothetical protein PKA64_21155 [Myxococcota bacterium]|nr:hypothetical protein [Myxococcota bacterium]
MAELLRERLGVEARLVPGARGEFTVRVGDEIVARKTLDGFPDPEACVAAVQHA